MMKLSVLLLLFGLCLGWAAVTPTVAPPTETVVAIDEDKAKTDKEAVDKRDIAIIQNSEDLEDLEVQCGPDDDYLADRLNCDKFYQCSNGLPVHHNCPEGLYFNIETKVCDWPHNVKCDPDRCDRRRIGRMSGRGDDDTSVARCPVGYVPFSCVANNPKTSDGTTVSGRDCTAFNSYGGGRQRAIATCIELDDDNFVFVNSGGWERQPKAQCPDGHRIVNCFLRNAWNHVQFAFPRILIGRNTCTSDITCSAGSGCFVQAVCRRINAWFDQGS